MIRSFRLKGLRDFCERYHPWHPYPGGPEDSPHADGSRHSQYDRRYCSFPGWGTPAEGIRISEEIKQFGSPHAGENADESAPLGNAGTPDGWQGRREEVGDATREGLPAFIQARSFNGSNARTLVALIGTRQDQNHEVREYPATCRAGPDNGKPGTAYAARNTPPPDRDQLRSYRSRFITLSQAETKSLTNFSPESAAA